MICLDMGSRRGVTPPKYVMVHVVTFGDTIREQGHKRKKGNFGRT
jgi:hypothetical protein